MLHGIGPLPAHAGEDERAYWTSQAQFDDVLALAREIPTRLTFDDGNETDVRVVLPALKTAGLTAAFFIPTDRIGCHGYLSEDGIRTLFAAGMEIGSHGAAHIDWTEISDVEIAHDVTASIERLQQIIAAPVRSVAIPYGACNRRVLAVLRRLGIAEVHSSFPGPVVDGAWLVRRDCIKVHMTQDDIRHLMTRVPDPAQTLLAFLRIWKYAGNAALRAA